jgi:hypothetical protein
MQWGVASQSSDDFEFLPMRGCHWAMSQSSAGRLAIAWEALFALDSLIFGLTIWRTWVVRGRRMRHHTGSGSRDVLGVVMRDGAMYFGTMALVNLANLLTFYLLDVRNLSSARSSVR